MQAAFGMMAWPCCLHAWALLLRIGHTKQGQHVRLMCAGLASTALVLSIAAPFGGNRWYLLTALSPLSGLYYWQRGTRKEEVQVQHLVLVFIAWKKGTCTGSCCPRACSTLTGH